MVGAIGGADGVNGSPLPGGSVPGQVWLETNLTELINGNFTKGSLTTFEGTVDIGGPADINVLGDIEKNYDPTNPAQTALSYVKFIMDGTYKGKQYKPDNIMWKPSDDVKSSVETLLSQAPPVGSDIHTQTTWLQNLLSAVEGNSAVESAPPSTPTDQNIVETFLGDVENGKLQNSNNLLWLMEQAGGGSFVADVQTKLAQEIDAYLEGGQTDADKIKLVTQFMSFALNGGEANGNSYPGFWPASDDVKNKVTQMLGAGPATGQSANDWIASILSEVQQNT